MEFGSETSFRAKLSLHNEKPMCPRNYAWKTVHQLFLFTRYRVLQQTRPWKLEHAGIYFGMSVGVFADIFFSSASFLFISRIFIYLYNIPYTKNNWTHKNKPNTVCCWNEIDRVHNIFFCASVFIMFEYENLWTFHLPWNSWINSTINE